MEAAADAQMMVDSPWKQTTYQPDEWSWWSCVNVAVLAAGDAPQCPRLPSSLLLLITSASHYRPAYTSTIPSLQPLE